MESSQNLLALRLQNQENGLVLDEYQTGDQEDFIGTDLEPERRAIITGQRPKRLCAFRWFGGKNSKLGFLLPLLPAVDTYVEPFGGSAAVLLNRDPCRNDVYNDIHGAVVNFFRVLRDPRSTNQLIEQLTLTPYAREEFVLATSRDQDDLSDVEWARRFFTVAIQGRDGMAQCAKPTHWSRASKGINTHLHTKLSRVPQLAWVAERLLHVTIDNRPAIEVIARYDSPHALIYADPPYLHSVRVCPEVYHKEMDDDEHRELAQALNAIHGKAAISGYDSALYRELYRGWNRHEDRLKRKPSGNTNAQEILWTNY